MSSKTGKIAHIFSDHFSMLAK